MESKFSVNGSNQHAAIIDDFLADLTVDGGGGPETKSEIEGADEAEATHKNMVRDRDQTGQERTANKVSDDMKGGEGEPFERTASAASSPEATNSIDEERFISTKLEGGSNSGTDLIERRTQNYQQQQQQGKSATEHSSSSPRVELFHNEEPHGKVHERYQVEHHVNEENARGDLADVPGQAEGGPSSSRETIDGRENDIRQCDEHDRDNAGGSALAAVGGKDAKAAAGTASLPTAYDLIERVETYNSPSAVLAEEAEDDDDWPALQNVLVGVRNLTRELKWEIAKAEEATRAGVREHQARISSVTDEIDQLKAKYTAIMERKKEKEMENKEALAALKAEEETGAELESNVALSKENLETLTSRIQSPTFSYDPVFVGGGGGMAVLAPSNVAFRRNTTREVVRYEGVCKAWTRALSSTNVLKMYVDPRRSPVSMKNGKTSDSDSNTLRESPIILRLFKGRALAEKKLRRRAIARPGGGGKEGGVDDGDDDDDDGKQKAKQQQSVEYDEHYVLNIEAGKANRKLSALRKRVHHLQNEIKGDRNEAGRWYHASIEEAKRKLASVREHTMTLKRQVDSNHATKRFLDETLAASEQSRVSLQEANAEILRKSREEIKQKEQELQRAEETKVGQQKKLEELNSHLKILVKTARTLKENVKQLSAQRDQLKARLRKIIA
eukprot:jgi/Bigna1/143946/aug1.82_g18654